MDALSTTLQQASAESADDDDERFLDVLLDDRLTPAESCRLHDEHLHLLRQMIELRVSGVMPVETFKRVVSDLEHKVMQDFNAFDRLKRQRPQLADITRQWLNQNNEMLRAYTKMKEYLADDDRGHLDEAVTIIECSLQERTGLYPAFN